jgi:toxin FitB
VVTLPQYRLPRRQECRSDRYYPRDAQPINDAVIAAIALVHGMTVTAWNLRDFASMGAPLLNPWDAFHGQ